MSVAPFSAMTISSIIGQFSMRKCLSLTTPNAMEAEKRYIKLSHCFTRTNSKFLKHATCRGLLLHIYLNIGRSIKLSSSNFESISTCSLSASSSPLRSKTSSSRSHFFTVSFFKLLKLCTKLDDKTLERNGQFSIIRILRLEKAPNKG